MRSSSLRSVLGLVLALAIPAAACTQQAAPAGQTPAPQTASPTAAAIAGGTMTQRLFGPWPTLDPHVTGNVNGGQIESGLYDTLIALVDAKVVPYLAMSWTESPTSVKFVLRKDATCSDGTPVTPTVVANSFKRLLITNAAKGASLLRGFGQGPYNAVADDSAGSVTISIGQPFSGLLFAFALPSAGIVCPAGIAASDSLATKPSGSGPFTLDSLVQDDSVTLVARPDWKWGPNGLTTRSSGFPQKVTYKVINNETTAANLLLTGGVDVASVDGADNTRLQADSSLIRKVDHDFAAVELLFNAADGRPTADQAVRQALSTAVDPADFGKATFFSSSPATSFIAPDAHCYDPSTKSLLPTPDLAKAKQVMTAAGYPVGPDGKFRSKSGGPLTISVIGWVNLNNGPDYLLDRFTAAGFDTKLAKTDLTTYAAAFLGTNFDVAVNASRASTPDPNAPITNLSGPPRPTGSNVTMKAYPAVEDEIKAANATTGDESCKHWANVQQEMLKRFVFFPTVSINDQWYGRGIELGNFLAHMINPMFLRRVK